MEKKDYSQDIEIMKRVNTGDRTAKHEVVVRLLKRIRNMVGYLTAYNDESEDLVQEGLIEVLKSAHNYRGESSIETWSDKIVIRLVMHNLRLLKNKNITEKNIEQHFNNIDLGNQIESEVDLYRFRKRIRVHLNKLNPHQRITVLLRLMHGYSVQEIAEITNSSTGTVKDRLFTGREKLKEYILKDPLLKDVIEDF